MAVATARTISLQGATGHLIDVQVDLSQGVVKTALVGRPDASISEARDRCRAAVTNSGFDWPATRRVTILLSPADLPKRGPHFDLAIAVAVLAASGTIPVAALAGVVFVGELTLDGRLRSVPGVLPMAMAASARGMRLRDGARAPGRRGGDGAGHDGDRGPLAGAGGRRASATTRSPTRPPVEPLVERAAAQLARGASGSSELDLADVLGMADARYALEVAAAGGHHLMLSGPKGAGKTTLAERIPGLLPDLAVERVARAQRDPLAGRVPARGPDHGHPAAVPRAAPLGVPGQPARRRHRPGPARARSAGRTPAPCSSTSSRCSTPTSSRRCASRWRAARSPIARGEEAATFPARAMFVLACNPCPCGDYHPTNRDNRCTCTEVRRRDYRSKISGPVADRIDITRHVEPVRAARGGRPAGPSRELRRGPGPGRGRPGAPGGTATPAPPWRLNADVPGPVLRERWPLTDEADRCWTEQVYAGG